jgi:hypothetical protein
LILVEQGVKIPITADYTENFNYFVGDSIDDEIVILNQTSIILAPFFSRFAKIWEAGDVAKFLGEAAQKLVGSIAR